MTESTGPTEPKSALLGRSFLGILVAQLFGSFNDNAFRLLIVAVLKERYRTLEDGESAEKAMVALTGALLVLPFLLFSTNAGRLSDRFSKRTVIVWSKLAEVALMVLGLFALWNGSTEALMALLFLMGTQSAFFSPAKYGILPEILPSEKLSKGNGVFELVNFSAIVLGMAFIGAFVFAAAQPGAAPSETYFAMVPMFLIVFSGIGMTASLFIEPVPPAAPNVSAWCNPLVEMRANLGILRESRVLGLTVLGVAFFWFVAPVLQQNILVYDRVWEDILPAEVELDDPPQTVQQPRAGAEVAGSEPLPNKPISQATVYVYVMLVVVALGIGIGSALAGILSGGHVELGLVPLGAIGICVFSLALSVSSGSIALSMVWTGLAAMSSGFYFVPLHTLLQHDSPPDKRGAVLATTNFFSFGAMLLASAAFFVLSTPLELGGPAIFAVIGIITLGVAIYLCWLLPDFLVRFLLWMGTHTLYRIRVAGRENVPEHGPYLLVANHTSHVDGLLIMAVHPRPIRFVVYSGYAKLPVFRLLARWMHTISISSTGGPRAIVKALGTAREALEAGEVVCIFAEGQVTRTGGLMPFHRGLERITKGLDVPVIPVYLDRVWGSIFSFQGGKFFWKVPRQLPYPVTVSFGTPMSSQSTAWQVRLAVQQLGAASFELRKRRQLPLHRQFVRIASRHPFRWCMGDSFTPVMRTGTTLVRVLVMARLLKRKLGEERMVGVLLPSTVAGAMVNIALTILGKVPVNLNYTISDEVLESSIRQCGIRQIVTSKLFLRKVKCKLSPECVFLEDFRREVRTSDKVAATAAFWLLPGWVLERLVLRLGKHKIDDLATIIFSSGSTGVPKGVMLSHHNVVSNIEGISQHIDVISKDVLVGTLPFFHSFGFTGTLWEPLLVGAKVVYHPSPLDAKEIGELCRVHHVTLFLSTATFLRRYIRRCGADDFRTARVILCGAEKLPVSLANAFGEKFGVTPLEGYGCTELSPVVSANVPDFVQNGIRQVGNKPGTIGHPLAGVAARIVDPESFEPLNPGKEGMLAIKGPNVMMGYLGKPDLTAEVIRDGWYMTGDVATIDDDGFITITDRLSRFSKIGGEMVPYIRIEEKLHEILGGEDLQLVITSVPDDRKGERLIVLHLPLEADLDQVWNALRASGLPNLWVPARNAFHEVAEIPILGTGKLDLRKVRELALEKEGRSSD